MVGREKEDMEQHLPHLVEMLTQRGYTAMTDQTVPLSTDNWKKWPWDIIWKHEDASLW